MGSGLFTEKGKIIDWVNLCCGGVWGTPPKCDESPGRLEESEPVEPMAPAAVEADL